MIIYNPLDGDAFTSSIPSNPRHCFLMTRLGKPIPAEVGDIGASISRACRTSGYKVIDASSRVTGRDFLLKIWRLVASAPISIGICHEDIPPATQLNIFYEIGVAQALGKETLIVKSKGAVIPSDFVRTEYLDFDARFPKRFGAYLKELAGQAHHYEHVADQLDRNPILAIDYLKRAFLITGDIRLRKKAQRLLKDAGLGARAKNSVEMLAAAF